MTVSVRAIALSSIAAIAFASSPARAQGDAWSLSVGVDPFKMKTSLNADENFIATLGREWSRKNSGLGFKAELTAGRDPQKVNLIYSETCELCSVSRSRSFAGLSGAASYTFRRDKSVRPYVLGGYGIYSVRTNLTANGVVFGNPDSPGSASTTAWSLGSVLGAGLNFRLFRKSFFVEQRFINSQVSRGGDMFIALPLSIGIKF